VKYAAAVQAARSGASGVMTTWPRAKSGVSSALARARSAPRPPRSRRASRKRKSERRQEWIAAAARMARTESPRSDAVPRMVQATSGGWS
jgi:hypothetical protein